MKRFNVKNINTPEYWDTHQTATDFGLRQQKCLQLAGKGVAMVELGCGISPLCYRATSQFDKVFGLDYSRATIENAKLLYPFVNYVLGDATKTVFHDNMFDSVIATEVIEHLEHPEDLIKEMLRICRPSGKIIISTAILEFKDPEHLWEFDEFYFAEQGFFTDVIVSDRFPGRKYIFAWKEKG